MKKIGEYSVRGQYSETLTESDGGLRVNLFDGRYDTGYKVTKFVVWAADWNNSTNPDVIGKLGLVSDLDTSSDGFMNAGDTREIGWAGASGATDAWYDFTPGIVDRDNLIIEELYVYVRGAGTANVNFLIEFDKYDLPDYRGSLAMVQNRSQG